MKQSDIKEYETGEHCFGEILNINGKSYEDFSEEDTMEFILDMLSNDINKESLKKDIIKIALEYLQFDLIDHDSNTCDQCGNWNSYEKYKLEDLKHFSEGFDVIITCTGAPDHIINIDLYEQLLQGETDKKIVIDLSVPSDLHPIVTEQHNVNHISVSHLQVISEENLKARAKEIGEVENILNSRLIEFNKIFRLRQIERAMGAVPQKVKEIKSNAINNVFANDLETLDNNSKEVLLKMMNFMEKKYMSIPMLMAKEILLEENKSWEEK